MVTSKDLVRADLVRGGPAGTGSACTGSRMTPQDAGSPRRRGLTLLFLGSIIVSFLAASAAPTPLYARYAERWGFSPLTTTVVFGVYALAVLATLLTFGRVSDHIGRVTGPADRPRPAGGGHSAVHDCRRSRDAAGRAGGAGAGDRIITRCRRGRDARPRPAPRRAGQLVRAWRRHGLGRAYLGPAVRYLPAPTHLIYLVLLGVFGIQAVGVLVMRETAARRRGPGGA